MKVLVINGSPRAKGKAKGADPPDEGGDRRYQLW